MINLENAYRITLTARHGKKEKRIVQYIEASDIDSANVKARNTFEASLYRGYIENGFEAQKACDKTRLNERLRFGFCGGWNTLDCTGLTIFEALEKAKFCFGASQDITEILPPIN